MVSWKWMNNNQSIMQQHAYNSKIYEKTDEFWRVFKSFMMGTIKEKSLDCHLLLWREG